MTRPVTITIVPPALCWRHNARPSVPDIEIMIELDRFMALCPACYGHFSGRAA